MSDFRFTDNTPDPVERPDLARHSEFHFTDKEIEEQIQAEKRRRQAELDAEMSKPAQPKPPPEDDFNFIDTPLSLSGEPRPDRPGRPGASGNKPGPPQSVQQPAAPGPATEAPKVAAANAPPVQQTGAGGPAPARAARKTAPAAATPIPGPKIPSPQPGSPQSTPQQPAAQAQGTTGQAGRGPAARVSAGRPAGGAAAGTPAPASPAAPAAKAAKDRAVAADVAANLKYAAVATTETVDPIYTESEQPAWRTLLDKLDPLFNGIVALAGLGALLSLAYILWGVFSGAVGQLPEDPVRAAEITRNITTASRLFTYCLFCGAIAGAILLLDEAWVGATIAVTGIAMHFGAVPALGGIGQTQPVLVLIQATRSIGFALLVIGLVKCTIDFARWLIDLPNRARLRATVGVATKAEAAQQRVAASAHLFSPCWQLPFCREVIRKQCPAYIARKRCWKFGRGCYCDEEMISRIVRGEAEEVVAAPTRMSRQGKPPCGRCYIFLEHQNLKYKAISPLAVPVTFAGMFMLWSPLMAAMGVAGQSLQGLWAKLSFTAVTATTSAAPQDIDAYTLSAEEVQRWASSIFGVLFGFLALIYISKFLEWAIYKAKW